ncbi:Protein IMPACT-A like protein [Verticillium longisporum]|nr:Protein IMPACT-A like protein [Verticillium longisporum]
MGQARLLQNAGLKSIQEIADAPFAVVREALGNQKTAKSVQSICRKHSDDAVSGGTNKRSLEGPVTPAAKKSRIGPFAIDGDGEARSPAEVEQSLAIPIITQEDQLRTTVIYINRAPEDESASEGVWSETNQQANPHNKGLTTSSLGNTARKEASGWSTSQRIDMRGSSFIAHSTPFTASDVAKSVIGAFIDSQPILKTASHNFWGYRIQRPETFTSFEGADDDGETGGGQFILRLLREADTVDRLVVVSRWFGGVMLGPDRWGLIRRCVNEALAEGLRLHNPVDLHQEVAFRSRL